MAEENNLSSHSFFDVLTARNIGNNIVEVGITEDGYKLYLERPSDGAGVAVDIDEETYKALERTFILVEKDEV